MLKNILIMRSYQRSKLFSQYLIKEGYHIYHEPLFDVEQINYKIKDKNIISSLIITSFNSCNTILLNKFAKNIKIYAIGNQSCEILKKNGYHNIEVASDRSVLSLIKKIKQDKNSKNYKLCYLRGQNISYDLTKDLIMSGYDIFEVICYKTNEFRSFSKEFLTNIKNINFLYILLYSQNSAKIFYNLAKRHNLVEKFKESKIICFSSQIADMVKNIDNNMWFNNTEIYKNINIIRNYYDK